MRKRKDRDPNGPPARPRLPSPLDGPETEVAPDAAPAPAESDQKQAGPRFSIRFLLLITLVVAVGTAGYNSMNLGGGRRVAALIFTVLAPLALLIALGVVHAITRRRKRR